MFKNIKHIHFVGIGGSGMSGIAEVLLNLGYAVSGSDMHRTGVVQRLEEKGAKVWEGHTASHIEGADVVVISTAVSANNPEVRAAHGAGIPVIPRVEMLAEIARLKYTVAVAGTHGKTTTTSLIGDILKEGGLDPTVIVGGRLKALGTGGVLGKGDFLVAEADESDGSFLKLSPAIAVITNIDNDHLDFYRSIENIEKAFVAFANRIPFYGITIICRDDQRAKKLIPKLHRRFETYGISKGSDLTAADIVNDEKGTNFQVIYKTQKLGTVCLPLSGRHNVLNALAAIGVGIKLNIPFNSIAKGLEKFEGVGRRLEFKGAGHGIQVFDDYGHHPTEIKATLQSLRDRYPKSRLQVIFQPHRYTRTKLLARDFASVLQKADHVYLMPIYPAGEKPIKGVSIDLIAKGMKKGVWSYWDQGKSYQRIAESLTEGDILLTLGAGDVWKVGEKFVIQSNTLASKLAQALPDLSQRIRTEESLSRHCTWGIGGPAEVYVEVLNVEELKTVVKIVRENNAPLFLLGWGSNVLFPDEGLRGCVVRLRGDFEAVTFFGKEVEVGAGVLLPKLAKMCVDQGLSGVEMLAGIPGTVGGALMSNAGTRKGSIGDVVSAVTAMDPNGSIRTITKDHLEFRYRWSNLREYWVISAKLELKDPSNTNPQMSMMEELDYRRQTQPLGTKNAGSVFCNPPHESAARLIEAAGLKGRQIGQVRVSPKHSNFIENLGTGTAKDVRMLMEVIQKSVLKEFGVDLSPEVRIIYPNEVKT